MTSQLTLSDILARAKQCARADASPAFREKVSLFRAAFDECATPGEGLNLFTFHIDVPDSHRVINYVDVKHDHGAFDYRKIASHFVWAGATFQRGARMFYVTNHSCQCPPPHAGLSVVRIPTDDTAPMLERVKAMLAYVESNAFTADTVFLDTDAYPNRPLAGVFDGQFDVGVTYRTTPGYMPLNEGVIFCSHSDPQAVRRFFAAYLGTYENLTRDPVIQQYYGNIGRWRGGQLSLNAIACPDGNVARVKRFEVNGIRIALFPCNTFNYWVTRLLQPGGKSWDRKFVLHLKGDSKKWLIDHVLEYQLGRGRERISDGQ